MGRGGLTDLDVLGIKLDDGFRVHSVVADCKTSRTQIPERIFWLTGVGKFFGSDQNIIVRSQSIPEHAYILARSMNVSMIGPNDLAIVENTYLSNPEVEGSDMKRFFSAELVDEAYERLLRLPQSLEYPRRYRESGYWMDQPNLRLQRVIVALQHIARDGSQGPIFHLAFADFVWLYVFALWSACQSLVSNRISAIEDGLMLYVSGGDTGLASLQRTQRAFEVLARRAHIPDVNLPLTPPYFRDLAELVTRLIRRPRATAQMARRAEWALMAQMVGGLPPQSTSPSRDDELADKLLGDVAHFLVRSSGLSRGFADTYVSMLRGVTVDQRDDVPIVASTDESSAPQQAPSSVTSDSTSERHEQEQLPAIDSSPPEASSAPGNVSAPT
jgi:hypothetical protein